LCDQIAGSLNAEVSKAYESQKAIEAEMQELQGQAQKFQKTVEGWAAATSAFDDALKELGDFENYVNVLEWDMKKVADSLERLATAQEAGRAPPSADPGPGGPPR